MTTIYRRQSDGEGGGGPPRLPKKDGRSVRQGRLVALSIGFGLAVLVLLWLAVAWSAG